MNKIILSGRLCDNPDVRWTNSKDPKAVAKYRLAVDRKYSQDGERVTDFINCVAFGKNGEFARSYLKKGMKIIVEGSLQTGSYTDKDGKKVYTAEVVVDSHEFCESKKTSGNDADSSLAPSGYEYPGASEPDFSALSDADGSLPFD